MEGKSLARILHLFQQEAVWGGAEDHSLLHCEGSYSAMRFLFVLEQNCILPRLQDISH